MVKKYGRSSIPPSLHPKRSRREYFDATFDATAKKKSYSSRGGGAGQKTKKRRKKEGCLKKKSQDVSVSFAIFAKKIS